MQRSNVALVALVSVLVATAAWSFSTQAANETRDDSPEALGCRAELEPEVVVAGGEIAIAVTFPGDLGEITAVRTEEASGIIVLGFDPIEAGMNSVTAQLEVPAAAAGAWWLEFDAKGETCKALLTVDESAPNQ